MAMIEERAVQAEEGRFSGDLGTTLLEVYLNQTGETAALERYWMTGHPQLRQAVFLSLRHVGDNQVIIEKGLESVSEVLSTLLIRDFLEAQNDKPAVIEYTLTILEEDPGILYPYLADLVSLVASSPQLEPALGSSHQYRSRLKRYAQRLDAIAEAARNKMPEP